jgi:HSP20 family molecular chaperone IbpA
MSVRDDDTLEGLQRKVERLFHDLVYHRHPSSHFSEPSWAPAADLVVGPQGARVLIELAGVPRDQVRVTLRGRRMEVSGRREPPRETSVDAHYHQAEIYCGDFRRVIELPWDADDQTIEARYRDGLLEIQVKPVVASRRTIPIEERSR